MSVTDPPGHPGEVTEVRRFLSDRVLRTYLDENVSRWRPLLTRLAQNTQHAQRAERADRLDTLRRACADDFLLARKLLHTEHAVFRDGMEMTARQTVPPHGDAAEPQPCEVWRPAVLQLLQSSMLVDLTLKEAVLSHWEEDASSISQDTLRVYCHALVSHPILTVDAVQHVLAKLA